MARSRAFCAEFSDATLSGVGGKEGMGEGLAAEAPLASGGCGPRTPGPDDPAGGVRLPRPPGRADPTTGYFCGAPGWNPGRAASAGARQTPRTVWQRSADTCARTQAPHPPALSPAPKARPPLTAAGSSEGSAPAAAAGREGARA